MNRRSKMLLSTGAALAVTGGAIVNFLAARQVPLTPQEELTLANIEALAVGPDELPGGNCNNFNGYRRIKPGNERIYDCCYVMHTGHGKEDCKRW
ncbi:hypothetical protein [Rikenella microfusus]|uniref:Uncharacterized protein n=1 Tax=Rikenella microfusus TaxID=28139 RepID=A0A379MVU9_9BACT|nr:hypothetical protein [Rikenella microfusus]SUE34967.1 Uncharacterised protein [Rikenella microfusus]